MHVTEREGESNYSYVTNTHAISCQTCKAKMMRAKV
jgi:hypothetical protein